MQCMSFCGRQQVPGAEKGLKEIWRACRERRWVGVGWCCPLTDELGWSPGFWWESVIAQEHSIFFLYLLTVHHSLSGLVAEGIKENKIALFFFCSQRTSWDQSFGHAGRCLYINCLDTTCKNNTGVWRWKEHKGPNILTTSKIKVTSQKDTPNRKCKKSRKCQTLHISGRYFMNRK